MRRYTFILSLLFFFLTLSFYLPASIKEVNFISREYVLSEKYLPQLIEFSRKEGISLKILQNWILAESSGRERAFNRKSLDYGLCQLHDVDYLVEKYWTSEEPFNIWNGEDNLYIGLAYLSDLIKTFGKKDAFLAYNIGRGRVSRGEKLKSGIEYLRKIWGEFLVTEKENRITFSVPESFLTLKEQLLFDDRRQRWGNERYNSFFLEATNG